MNKFIEGVKEAFDPGILGSIFGCIILTLITVVFIGILLKILLMISGR